MGFNSESAVTQAFGAVPDALLGARELATAQDPCGRLFRLGDPEALIDFWTFQLLDGAGRPPDLDVLDPGLGA